MTTLRADLPTHASAKTLKRDVDFLVVGTPRSGTTLVQRLACELPGVGMPRETEFWLGYRSSPLRSASFPLEGADLREQLDRLVSGRPLSRQEIDVDALMLGMGARCDSPVEMFSGLVRFLAGAPHLAGEKTPSHLWWWQPLAGAMPGLKIVGVVRDPRAVAASMQHMPWGPDRPALVSEWWAADQQLFDASILLPAGSGPHPPVRGRCVGVAPRSGATCQVPGDRGTRPGCWAGRRSSLRCRPVVDALGRSNP